MFYAYVIQSIADPNYYYKGHCENLEARLKQYNSGMTKSIKHKLPFKIVHSAAFNQRLEAIAREKYWKTSAGRRYLQRIINLVP